MKKFSRRTKTLSAVLQTLSCVIKRKKKKKSPFSLSPPFVYKCTSFSKEMKTGVLSILYYYMMIN